MSIPNQVTPIPGSRYSPVPGYPALRNAIVEKLKKENGLEYTAAQISCANGAKQSVCNTIMVLVNPGDEVIVPAPYWVSYPEMVKLAEGTPVIVTAGIEQDFKITPAQLEAAITPKTKALILCSPSNPTGSVYSKEELAGLAAVLAKYPQVIVVADEPRRPTPTRAPTRTSSPACAKRFAARCLWCRRRTRLRRELRISCA